MAQVTLKELKELRDWLPLRNIKVKPEQRKYTTNLIMSFLQSRHPAVTMFAVYDGEKLVGYVMLVHSQNPAQWIIERLTIDRDYQRQGYGYAVTDELIDMVHGFENSEMVIARYDPKNDAARQLFMKFNFEQQDEIVNKRYIALLEFEFEVVEGDTAEDDNDDDTSDDDPSDDLTETELE